MRAKKDETLVFCGCLSKGAVTIRNCNLASLIQRRSPPSQGLHVPCTGIGRRLRERAGLKGEDKENCDRVGGARGQ